MLKTLADSESPPARVQRLSMTANAHTVEHQLHAAVQLVDLPLWRPGSHRDTVLAHLSSSEETERSLDVVPSVAS